ncbi:MAG: hypothetical protein Q8O29_11825 [Polaromonas sp.]|uniref:hypothetical protein n=1 Tax=Polaromonas sp. TaxID=1869339 RepID=UPI002734996B|nr:hypothetical protein [Polaromonas sp.]MDP2818936.1 hypothetical protein [Polaromonas sp.]
MRRATRTILSLLMLVFLLTSMGVRGFHSKELVHDLDHHGRTSIATLDIAHTGALESGGKLKAEPLDEFEHQLAHAVSTLYMLASATASFSWNASAQILVPASSFPSLPVAELEPPFRPP